MPTHQNQTVPEILFQTEIPPSEPAWMGDHRVFGRVVAPGAMYGAMAASALLAEADGPVAVEDMQLHSPLILAEDGRDDEIGDRFRPLQLVLDARDGRQSRRAAIFNKNSDWGWTLHAESRVARGIPASNDGAKVDLESLKVGLAPQDMPAFYRAKGDAGIDFGPAFRGVRAVWSRQGEEVGEVALPIGVEHDGIVVHPLLLDGCFQVLSAARSADDDGDPATYLPFGWERL